MTLSGFLDAALGRLDWNALPFWEMVAHPSASSIINGLIASGAAGVMVLGALVTVWALTRYSLWGVLWRDWLTSLDHKKIGIMYIALAFVMLARALAEASVMRTQQAVGLGGGFLSPEHFSQLFSTHGTIMIFFMAMPFLTGVINFVVPLQIGARDVAFPLLNSVSLALTAAGAALVMASLLLTPFSIGGWSGYPPFTETGYSPDVGPDYWIWAVTLSSLGTTLAGMNFAVTIYKKRAPGMTMFRMPLFCWTALCVSILMIFAMPPLTLATSMLALDRYLDFHFFTNTGGGDPMLYANMFWLFGHPEVYILILPAFGVYSEVISTLSGKKLYGYTSLALATICIAVLSFTVWVHHFFTMGQSASLNAVFGIATMLIGIPTGVKVYDWMLTLYRGRVRLGVPMIYAMGFLMLFVIGGATGIMLANPSLDYVTHNTLFLVAHFHNMLIPGTLFGMLAAYAFWFPKAFGFRLEEKWGRRAAVSWIAGFILAFFPLYGLGLLGMPRRTVAFFEPAYLPFTLVALAGAGLVLFAFGCLVAQLVVSIRERERRRVPAGDPWDGRSLEWSIPAPAPEWNFAVLPKVETRDPFTEAKEQGRAYLSPEDYEDIEMPRNSAVGPIVGVAGFACAFGLVWYMWWLATLGALLGLGAMLARGFVRDTVRVIPAAEVRKAHESWLAMVHATPRIPRHEENTPANLGHAIPASQEEQ
ncbi:cbb3-type cytochrome c oxidase subunit I [Limimaricola cinnabarinus]|uniref:cbb3-type cytochrome c oxidase subunit I n=1 Tax=Limimaricola cinnabarinus TaxID=1125964 RepID=UPI0024934475|nr:cbb3-type cytochrome c oxidase subunit I [Limimaricola cinnabarinus]